MNSLNGRAGLSLALAACAAAAALAGCDQQALSPHRFDSEWSNLTLNMMMEKYGVPDRIDTKRVVWLNKGPWKQISVWDGLDDEEGLIGANVVEETIAYLVPRNKRDDLNGFHAEVEISADGAELSTRAPSEERNFLALNLADEIIRGVRTPEAANGFYASTLRLADAGKSSPYLKGLLFRPPPPTPSTP
jgi:hypothetical protein